MQQYSPQEIGKNYNKKFLYTLIVIFLLVAIPVAAFFSVLWFIKNTISQDQADTYMITAAIVLVVVYVPIASWIFFALPKKILSFRPFSGVAVKTRQDMMSIIEKLFTGTTKNQHNIFDVNTEVNTMRITWSKEVFANQLLAVSNTSVKHLFILTFDDSAKRIKIVQRDVDSGFSLSASGASARMGFAQGIFMEYQKQFIPSVSVSEKGLSFDVNRISYNSNEIVKPILYAAATNGWAACFGIM